MFTRSASSEIGHWTLLMRRRGGFIYFDSSGKNPAQQVLDYMLGYDDLIPPTEGGRATTITLCHKDVQESYSNLCGYYVLYMLDNIIGSVTDGADSAFRIALGRFVDDNIEANKKVLLDHFNLHRM